MHEGKPHFKQPASESTKVNVGPNPAAMKAGDLFFAKQKKKYGPTGGFTGFITNLFSGGSTHTQTPGMSTIEKETQVKPKGTRG